MDLRLSYNKVDNQADAFRTVKKSITPAHMEKYKVKANFDYDESNHRITAKGKGFTLKVDFKDSAAELNLDLSFMLKPLKGQVLASLEKEFKSVL